MYTTKSMETNIYKIKLPKSVDKDKFIIKYYVSNAISKSITQKLVGISKDLISSILKSLD